MHLIVSEKKKLNMKVVDGYILFKEHEVINMSSVSQFLYKTLLSWESDP